MLFMIPQVEAKKTSHQQQALHSTTQEVVPHPVPLKIGHGAPTPYLATISTTECLDQPADIWMTSNNHLQGRHITQTVSSSAQQTEGTHHPHMV